MKSFYIFTVNIDLIFNIFMIFTEKSKFSHLFNSTWLLNINNYKNVNFSYFYFDQTIDDYNTC